MNCKKKNTQGFTLAELLIVVAIIGILVAISIPIFASKIEISREATDLSNVRSMYSEVMYAANAEDKTSPLYQSDGTYEGTVDLKQKKDGWTTPESKLNIAGIQSTDENWQGLPKANGTCKVKYDPESNKATISWSASGNPKYLSATSPYQNKSLMSLKEEDNNKRIEADRTTLTAIGEEILKQNWTVKDLKNNLGILSDGSAVRIANYRQKKTGSYEEGGTYTSDGFQMSVADGFLDILKAVGYDGGNSNITESNNGKTDITYDNPLFYSDQLASNKLRNFAIDKTLRSIIITDYKTDSSGVLTGFTIYSKAMDGEANLTNQEKETFKLKVGK